MDTMPTPDDSTTAEFRSIIAAAGLPWETAESTYMPWTAMAHGCAAILVEHLPTLYETPAGEVRCRCSCGQSGVDLATPYLWATHVSRVVYRGPGC